MVEGEAAQEHGGGVEAEGEEEEEVIDVVVAAESFSPKEHGVNHAKAVNDNGEQEEVSVSKAVHSDRLARWDGGARDNVAVLGWPDVWVRVCSGHSV